jgi:glucose 1-dehydrogenase
MIVGKWGAPKRALSGKSCKPLASAVHQVVQSFWGFSMTTTQTLSGQTALITGSSTGIGEAVARAMAKAGASVVINYLSHGEDAQRIAKELRDAGAQAIAIEADVSKEDEVEKMFQEVVSKLGTLDILVNNAGIQQDAAFQEMTLEQWRKVIDVNVTSQFLCSRAAIKEFLRRGPREDISKALGKIICMSSVHQEIPWAGHVNYAASKGAISMLMRTLAQEFGPKRIRVNAIAPGAIKTDINREVWSDPEGRAKMMSLIPYGRIGETEDVAKAAVWLASDDSDYVHGTTLFIDGGMTLYPAFADGG